MSWSLFNQNLENTQFNPGGYPEGPAEVDAEEVWGSPSTTHDDTAFTTNGFFACDSINTKLMVVPKGFGGVYYTGDGGETFSGYKDIPDPDNNSYRVTYLRYDAILDDFWLSNNNAAFNYYYFSENNGDSWGQAATSYAANSGRCFYVGPDGSLFVSHLSPGGSDSYLIKYPTPKSNNTNTVRIFDPGGNTWWTIQPVNGNLLFTYTNGANGYLYVSNTSLASDAANPANTVTFTGTRVNATSGSDALYYRSATSNTLTMDQADGDLPWLSNVVVDFGEAVTDHQISYGDGRFLVSGIRASDTTQMLVMVAVQGDYSVWNGPYTIQLGHPQTSEGSFRRQVEYWGEGQWLVAYRTPRPSPNQALHYLVIEKFQISGTTTPPTYAQTLLRQAISRQAPDIFCLFDDEVGASTVIDIGSKGYTNSVVGTVTFERTGLVADLGTAALFGAATNTGVLVEAVPTPTNHAHFFVLTHDGTASVRVLACSGDFDNTVGYYVFLAANHKLGVAVYDGGWQYVYSTTALTLNTIYRCAVSVASDGRVTFYIGTAWDAASEDVPYTALTATTLSLGGGWTGGSALSSSANGVTVDYYALIPLETFDYQLIVEAEGGTYTPPTPVISEEVEGVQFLVHANETTLTTVNLSGVRAYQFVNSVPGSLNRVVSELTSSATVADSKFGAGAMTVPGSDRFLWSTPPEAPYWVEGGNLELGTQDFTYDLWAKTQGSNNITVPGSSHGAHPRGTYYDEYGGISFITSRDTATTVDVYIKIGCSLSSALNGRRADIEMQFNCAGYVDGGYNHFAFCRLNGLWAVYVNGRKATVVGVVRRNGQHEDTVWVHRGGKWWIGGRYRITNRSEPQTAGRLTTYQSRYDEIRLIVGRAEFTENFIAPTAPYDYD